LMADLSPGTIELLKKYDSVEGGQEGRKADLLYQQGFRDGLQLKYRIARLRRGDETVPPD
jgi:hypothetical protein